MLRCIWSIDWIGSKRDYVLRQKYHYTLAYSVLLLLLLPCSLSLLYIFFISHQITFLAILFLSSCFFFSLSHYQAVRVFVLFFFISHRSSCRVHPTPTECRAERYTQQRQHTQHKRTNYIHFIFYFCTQRYSLSPSSLCVGIFFYFSIFFPFFSFVSVLCYCFDSLVCCKSHNTQNVHGTSVGTTACSRGISTRNARKANSKYVALWMCLGNTQCQNIYTIAEKQQIIQFYNIILCIRQQCTP